MWPTPAAASWWTTMSRIARSPTGSSGFGSTVVYGSRREPRPPARMTARSTGKAAILDRDDRPRRQRPMSAHPDDRPQHDRAGGRRHPRQGRDARVLRRDGARAGGARVRRLHPRAVAGARADRVRRVRDGRDPHPHGRGRARDGPAAAHRRAAGEARVRVRGRDRGDRRRVRGRLHGRGPRGGGDPRRGGGGRAVREVVLRDVPGARRHAPGGDELHRPALRHRRGRHRRDAGRRGRGGGRGGLPRRRAARARLRRAAAGGDRAAELAPVDARGRGSSCGRRRRSGSGCCSTPRCSGSTR